MTPLLDTGPLVALFDRDDRHHGWARTTLGALRSGAVTSEACVAETLFLCARNRVSVEPLFVLLESATLRVESMLVETPKTLSAHLRRWSNVPMSLADASLVVLHEQTPRSVVVTFDSDFRVYRTSKGRPIRTFGP